MHLWFALACGFTLIFMTLQCCARSMAMSKSESTCRAMVQLLVALHRSARTARLTPCTPHSGHDIIAVLLTPPLLPRSEVPLSRRGCQENRHRVISWYCAESGGVQGESPPLVISIIRKVRYFAILVKIYKPYLYIMHHVLA